MSAFATTLASLPQLVGTTFGPSSARVVTQADVDAFAALTGDAQWIHTDPERAAAEGGTIVHGFFALSLIGGFWGDLLEVTDAPSAVNYGLDHVRFLARVPVGSALSATAEVVAVDERADGVKVSLSVSIHADTAERPAVVATSIVLFHR